MLLVKNIVLIAVLIVFIIFFLNLIYRKNNINEGMYSKTPDFLPSSKFTGSKKGYVFKISEKGLGYYIDIKPVIEI